MDLLSNLSLGFGVAVTPINLLYAFIGCFLGTLIGVLPGIGPLALANDGPAGAFHPQEDGGFIHTIDLRRFISYVLTDLLEAEASPESVGTSHQELRRLLTGKQMPVHAKPRMKRRKKAVAPIPCTPVPGIRFHAEHAL